MIDEQYYEEAAPKTLGEKLLVAARNRIYYNMGLHYNWSPSFKILDFGVSDTITDGANFLERLHPYPSSITAVGLGAGTEFRKTYPSVTYQQVLPLQTLPYDNNQFDLATSNAVFEHMGSRDNQIWMLEELSRVAKSIYVTVPNRMFPVEHHTAIPLLHYSKALFKTACKLLHKTYWIDEQNLILVDKKYLRSCSSGLRHMEIGYTGLPLGPFSSNLYLKYDSA